MNEETNTTEINANDILDEWEFSDKALINRGKTDYRFDIAFTVDRWRV